MAATWVRCETVSDRTYLMLVQSAELPPVKNSIFLSSSLKLNLFLTMSQVTRKFRLFFLPYLTIPPAVWFAMPTLMKMNSEDVKARIERRGQTEHLDYFETLIPFDKPVPKEKNEIHHLENVAGQLLLASWQPLANQFYSVLFFLLKEPEVYARLVKEVRIACVDSDAINMDTVGGLKYLHGCVQEGLRLHQDTVDGLPRVSPGAVVDGQFIPPGVSFAESSRYMLLCDYSDALTEVRIRSPVKSPTLPHREAHATLRMRSSSAQKGGYHTTTQDSIQGIKTMT
jgi:hypothetical protein